MTRAQAAIGTIAFFVIVPGTVAGLVPWLISGWQSPQPWPLLRIPLFLGALLVLGGLWVLIDSFVQFARSLGTPAPIAPTERLVVEGWYRYVRNPMYVAVLAIILGQALVFWNIWLMAYAAAAFLAVHFFVIGYEEPTLRTKFPNEYAARSSRTNMPPMPPTCRAGVRGSGHGAARRVPNRVFARHAPAPCKHHERLHDASWAVTFAAMLGRLYEGQNCSAARALELIGERWSLLILRDAMFGGYTRFSQFQKGLGVATNILAKRLEDLVASGIMERRAGPSGEQAEYFLTQKGLELKPVVVALTQWGDKWVRPGPVRFETERGGHPVTVELRTPKSEVGVGEVVARPR